MGTREGCPYNIVGPPIIGVTADWVWQIFIKCYNYKSQLRGLPR